MGLLSGKWVIQLGHQTVKVGDWLVIINWEVLQELHGEWLAINGEALMGEHANQLEVK